MIPRREAYDVEALWIHQICVLPSDVMEMNRARSSMESKIALYLLLPSFLPSLCLLLLVAADVLLVQGSILFFWLCEVYVVRYPTGHYVKFGCIVRHLAGWVCLKTNKKKLGCRGRRIDMLLRVTKTISRECADLADKHTKSLLALR